MTDLEIYQPPAGLAVPVVAEMDSWIAVCSDVIKVANVICDTPFVPDGLRGSGPAVAAAILAGRELSLGPMTSLANIHVIKGKPALSAVLMRALVQAQGHQWQDGDVTDTRAVVRGRRKGESEWTEVSFTADQAKRAGIELGKYPQDKLYARATSRLARRKFADVIAGMPYSAEELEDGAGDVILAGESYHPLTEAAAEQPKQRTAQRRQKTATTDPTPAGAGSAETPSPADSPSAAATASLAPADAYTDLPPLPGEDEPEHEPDGAGYDTPGTVTKPQLTKIAVVFGELGFARDERDQRLTIAGQIIRRRIGTSNELSRNEASTLIDTLERCGTRENLIALLTEGEAPDE